MKPVSQSINAGVLFVLLFTGGFVQAQKKEYTTPEEDKRIVISLVGGGGGFWNSPGGLSGFFTVQYNIKNHFLQFQAGGLTEVGLFGTDYSDATDVGLLYGISRREKKWKLSAAAGVGYYKYSISVNQGGGGLFDSPSSRSNYKRTSQTTVGFPVTGSVIFHPRRLGIGIQVNANINSIKSYGTVGVVYTFRF